MEIIVADSSPLIALLNIHRLELLPALFTTIIVPPAVASEIEPGEQPDSPWFMLKKRDFIRIAHCNENDSRLTILRLQLDAGESEAILLAKQRGLPLLIDERGGRNMARDMGLNIVGLVGALLALKQKGRLPTNSLIEVVEALECARFRMSKELKALLLQ